MAVLRQNSYNSQQRIDVPHLRSIESAICADFDLLSGTILAGKIPLIVKGFTIPTSGTINTPASGLVLNVAGGILIHYGASDSGSIFSVPDTQAVEPLISTNTNVSGTFNSNSTNYVGIDLIRIIDDSTADLVKFLDADTDLETSEVIPLARTFTYRIIISNQNFTASSNVAPIAIVVTDVNNKVVSITDARNMIFRLGSGGDSANAENVYDWGVRTENPILYNNTNTLDPFSGEDKNIFSFKDWADAVMTRLWEIGSGEHWYSPTTRDDVKILYGQPVIAATQDNFQWDSGTNTLTYSGIAIAFGNSTEAYYNTIVNDSKVLNADGQCLYVDLDRTTNGATLTTKVGTLETLGTPAIPGSRFVFAWRQNGNIYARDRTYEVGRSTIVATTSVLGIVKLNQTPADSLNPTVATIMAGGGIKINTTTTTGVAVIGIGGGSAPVISASGNGGYFIGGNSPDGVNQDGAAGIWAIGGTCGTASSPGPGALFQGGSGNSLPDSACGVKGVGGDSSAGVVGIGGTVGNASGGNFLGGNDGDGVIGNGSGTGIGGNFSGGVSGGDGVHGQGGVGNGNGGKFTGGATNGVGVIGIGSGGTNTVGSSNQGGIFVGGGGNGIGIQGQGAGTGSGGRFAPGGTANFAIESVGNIAMTGSAPSSSAAYSNILTPGNFIKAWGFVTNTGSAYSIGGGFNLSGATLEISDHGVTVSFASSFANTNYAVIVIPHTVYDSTATRPVSAICYGKSVGSCNIGFYSLGGAPIDCTPTTTAVTSFSIMIIGLQ